MDQCAEGEMLRVIHPTPDSVMTYGAKDAGNLFLMIVAVFCNASVRHADFGVDLGLWVAEGLVTEVHKCTRTDHAQDLASTSNTRPALIRRAVHGELRNANDAFARSMAAGYVNYNFGVETPFLDCVVAIKPQVSRQLHFDQNFRHRLVGMIDHASINEKVTTYFTAAFAPQCNTSTVAYNFWHDASMAVTCDGELLTAIEFAMLFGVTSMWVNIGRQHEQLAAVREVTQRVLGAIGFGGHIFGRGVLICWLSQDSCAEIYPLRNIVMPDQIIVEAAVQARKWEMIDHHRAHAAFGFFDSPFDEAVIISYDGWGNDGSFMMYVAERIEAFNNKPLDVEMLQSLRIQTALNCNASVLSRMSCAQSAGMALVGQFDESIGELLHVTATTILNVSMDDLSLMAADGRVRSEWVDGFKVLAESTSIATKYTMAELQIGREMLHINDILSGSHRKLKTLPSGCRPQEMMHYGFRVVCTQWDPTIVSNVVGINEPLPLSGDAANDGAATMQSVFQGYLIHAIELLHETALSTGLVLTGGAALFTSVNTAIAEALEPIDIHVASVPHDAGLAIGAAWAVQPPSFDPRRLAPAELQDVDGRAVFSGPRLLDRHKLLDHNWLQKTALKWRITNRFDLREMMAAHPLLGVARRKAELGFRALGRRALIAPLTIQNLALVRRRYGWTDKRIMPVAVDADRLTNLFDCTSQIRSPYMSFALRPSDGLLGSLSAGSEGERVFMVQTLEPFHSEDHLLFSLLRNDDLGALIVAPLAGIDGERFNTNKVEAILENLYPEPESLAIGAIVIEDLLFTRRNK